MTFLKAFIPVILAGVLLGGCAGHRTAFQQSENVTLEVTGYCKCGHCCGWNRNFLMQPVYASGPQAGERKKVGITACGTKAKPGTIAADTNVFPFGTRIRVPGYGWGTVEDRGGAIKGGRLDLFFDSHEEALQWGRRNVEVEVIRP